MVKAMPFCRGEKVGCGGGVETNLLQALGDEQAAGAWDMSAQYSKPRTLLRLLI
jgi:hypothetical protein